ncbi:uncharacterized protein RCO7_10296 [Rhynchosporium graminicola]|uniref:Uncharacterized protein n=1 Tax=Rhynchosporium graminicola TaxID=2792576 RepID=A0A1E1K8D7_9HELO|nr:uncharacterized protein RCO7_10296 [Rhynchosporium commune]
MKIDELAFHEKAVFLEACSRSQKEESPSQLNINVQNKLDLPSARHFLDSFALVAASPGGAPNVTAACLELSQSNSKEITIRIAKNEDFNVQARQRLSQITGIMNRLSVRVDTQMKARPVEPGKLGACKDVDLDENEESERLAKSHWTEIRELVDKLHITTDLEAIKQLARLAYNVRHSIDFHNLVRTQCQLRKQSSQILERIGKVAKFFRSAVSLVQQKYIVHAEMLLLTFYEEHPQIVLATNYIGISKRSCYLCANFIRFHNFFAIKGQHQQLYCLWTLPADVTFESQARGAIFMKALSDLDSLLAHKIDKVTRPQHKLLAFLKESVANFSRATITARAHSLENPGVVVESDEGVGLSTSRMPLRNRGEHPDVRLEPRERGISELHQDRVNTEISSSPVTEEGSLPRHLETIEYLQAPLAVFPKLEILTFNDPDEELQYVEKRSHHHRTRRSRHTGGHYHRKRRRRAPSAQRYNHQVTMKAATRRQKIRSPVLLPIHASTQLSKRTTRKRRKSDTVGYLNMLLTCLKSAGRAALETFWERI